MDFFVTKNCVLTSARVAVKIPDPLKILSHKSSEVIQFNTVLELKLHLPLQIPNRERRWFLKATVKATDLFANMRQHLRPVRLEVNAFLSILKRFFELV